jgi:hypothetical protein
MALRLAAASRAVTGYSRRSLLPVSFAHGEVSYTFVISCRTHVICVLILYDDDDGELHVLTWQHVLFVPCSFFLPFRK